jgi:hypothetical protein
MNFPLAATEEVLGLILGEPMLCPSPLAIPSETIDSFLSLNSSRVPIYFDALLD